MSSNILCQKNTVLFRLKETENIVKKSYNIRALSDIHGFQSGMFSFPTERGMKEDFVKEDLNDSGDLYRIQLANGAWFYAGSNTKVYTKDMVIKDAPSLTEDDSIPLLLGSYFGESRDLTEDDGIFTGICCTRYFESDRCYNLIYHADESEAFDFSINYLKNNNINYTVRELSGDIKVIDISDRPKILSDFLNISQKYALYYDEVYREGYLHGLYKNRHGFYYSDGTSLYVRKIARFEEFFDQMFLLYLSLGIFVKIEDLEDQIELKITPVDYDDSLYVKDGDKVYTKITKIEKSEAPENSFCTLDCPGETLDYSCLVLAKGILMPFRY
jgi:hypothetical protein